MGKKPQRHGWPEAKKLCRLNQDDIEMAKRLGFVPDSLIRARPDPKQRWKLPVREWIHELHFKRFGHVIGEKPVVVKPAKIEFDAEAARCFEEEMFWDDYCERNAGDGSHTRRKKTAQQATGPPGQLQEQPQPRPAPATENTDEDVPF